MKAIAELETFIRGILNLQLCDQDGVSFYKNKLQPLSFLYYFIE